MAKAYNTARGTTGGRQFSKSEICSYIFDLLRSIELIAHQHDLPMLARLTSLAKVEAKECIKSYANEVN
jgi:hypothetical protein